MYPYIKIELRGEEKFFGPGVCELLELIDRTGSLQSACLEMNLSYSKGSRMIRGIEKQLGISAVHRWTGGSGGGGAELTKEGRLLLEHYRDMVEDIKSYTDKVFDMYFGDGWIGGTPDEAD